MKLGVLSHFKENVKCRAVCGAYMGIWVCLRVYVEILPDT